MTPQDFNEFSALLDRTAIVTFLQRGKDWETLVTTMFEELAGYDLEAIRGALRDHVRSEKFFPTLADIVTRIDGTAEDRAALAWSLVMRAIERHGAYESVRFPSPAFHFAIAEMGGWQHLARIELADVPFRAKDFARFFTIGESEASWGFEPDKKHVPQYLAGHHETWNRAVGILREPCVYDVQTGARIDVLALPSQAGQPAITPILEQLTEKMGGVAR